jgi:hypothetical protein
MAASSRTAQCPTTSPSAKPEDVDLWPYDVVAGHGLAKTDISPLVL